MSGARICSRRMSGARICSRLLRFARRPTWRCCTRLRRCSGRGPPGRHPPGRHVSNGHIAGHHPCRDHGSREATTFLRLALIPHLNLAHGQEVGADIANSGHIANPLASTADDDVRTNANTPITRDGNTLLWRHRRQRRHRRCSIGTGKDWHGLGGRVTLHQVAALVDEEILRLFGHAIVNGLPRR